MRIMHENPELHGAKRRFLPFLCIAKRVIVRSTPLFGGGEPQLIYVTVHRKAGFGLLWPETKSGILGIPDLVLEVQRKVWMSVVRFNKGNGEFYVRISHQPNFL